MAGVQQDTDTKDRPTLGTDEEEDILQRSDRVRYLIPPFTRSRCPRNVLLKPTVNYVGPEGGEWQRI